MLCVNVAAFSAAMNVPFFGPQTFKDYVKQEISFSPHEEGWGFGDWYPIPRILRILRF